MGYFRENRNLGPAGDPFGYGVFILQQVQDERCDARQQVRDKRMIPGNRPDPGRPYGPSRVLTP